MSELGFSPFEQPEEEPRQIWVCRCCTSTLVRVTDFVETDKYHWRVWTQCPECWDESEGVYTNEEAEAYDTEDERARDAMLLDYAARGNGVMKYQAEFFARALMADLITPDDITSTSSDVLYEGPIRNRVP